MPVPAAAPTIGDDGQPVLGVACAKKKTRRAAGLVDYAASESCTVSVVRSEVAPVPPENWYSAVNW